MLHFNYILENEIPKNGRYITENEFKKIKDYNVLVDKKLIVKNDNVLMYYDEKDRKWVDTLISVGLIISGLVAELV